MVDTIAHGLWSYIIFNQAISFPEMWLAIFFGVMPDLFSWTIYAGYTLFKKKRLGAPKIREIPNWAFTLYGITHSVFVIALTFIVVYLLLGKVPLYLLAWPIHVLIDIPTHSRKFLPTPFLWPIFEWKFPGVSWANPWILYTNWMLILIFMIKIIIF